MVFFFPEGCSDFRALTGEWRLWLVDFDRNEVQSPVHNESGFARGSLHWVSFWVGGLSCWVLPHSFTGIHLT